MYHVLYVDDEPDFLEISKLYLERSGEFTFDTSTSAKDLVKSGRLQSYDAIISDYLMPKMDGIEFLKEVRSQVGDIPFILFTGKGREDVAIEAINNGADFYLQKGSDPESQFAELAHKIKMAVGRQRAQEALRVAQEKFTKAFLSAPDAITISELESGRFIEVNDAASRIFGYTRYELIGKSAHELGIWLNKESRETCIDRIKKEGRISEVEIVERRKSGELYTASITADTITIGNTRYFIAIIRDITERKQLEDALRESEKRYHSLVDQVPELILVHQNGIIRYTNPFAVKTLGYTPEEVLNRPVTDFISPEYHERIAAAMRLRMNGEKVEPYEIEIIGKTGGRRTVIISGSQIEFGGMPATLNVLTDITERKETEINLARAEQRLSAHIENSPLAIIEFDPQFRVIRWTLEAERIFGWTSGEIMGQALSEMKLVYDEDRELVRKESAALLRGERSRSLNINRNYKKDGSVIYCEWYNSGIYDEKGHLISIFSLVLDVTERKALQAAIQEANKKLNLLSSITRHDILNQLLSLRAYLQISRDYLDDKKNMLLYLEKVEKAATTIEHQITFTRNYQDMGVKAPAWQSVNANISKAMAALPLQDVKVPVDFTDLEIFADPLFEKVFYNLIDNALRYGGAGMKTICVSSQESDSGLNIVCEDDGVGISDKDKACLFTRGFGKNSGLGLFLTREILSITGITIRENGEPSKGARFEITVPKGMYRFRRNEQK